jgi:hypothetical protein
MAAHNVAKIMSQRNIKNGLDISIATTIKSKSPSQKHNFHYLKGLTTIREYKTKLGQSSSSHQPDQVATEDHS